jgi:hypoxanthine-guanine phosphoribosyltransferase
VEEREGKNPEQIAKVRKMRDIMLKSIYSKGNLNKDFQVKMVTKSSLRRYFHKFMHINDKLDEQLFLKINNGKILIIDDSFGSGVTMKESSRAIKHLNPKTVDAFILLHDYAPTAKKTG